MLWIYWDLICYKCQLVSRNTMWFKYVSFFFQSFYSHPVSHPLQTIMWINWIEMLWYDVNLQCIFHLNYPVNSNLILTCCEIIFPLFNKFWNIWLNYLLTIVISYSHYYSMIFHRSQKYYYIYMQSNFELFLGRGRGWVKLGKPQKGRWSHNSDTISEHINFSVHFICPSKMCFLKSTLNELHSNSCKLHFKY